MGPIPASVIAIPEALFNLFVKNELSASENDELLKPYPIAKTKARINLLVKCKHVV